MSDPGRSDLNEGDEGSPQAGNGDEIKDEDLKTAAFLNNYEFVSDWLKCFNKEETDQEVYAERRGNVLRQACYFHSIDVVKCIAQPGDCEGE